MGGIAEQGQPVADETARYPEREGIGARAAFQGDLAEFEAETTLDFEQEVAVVERQQRRNVLTALGPDNRGTMAELAAIGQRQDGERARRQEVFDRPPLMRPLMADRRDNP
jgi:hypothetical protein